MASLKRNTLMGAAASVVYLGASFVMNGIASRVLIKADFGTIQYDIWMAQVVWTVASLGIPNALVRTIPQYFGGNEAALRSTLRALFLVSLAGLGLGLAGLLLIARGTPGLERCLVAGVFLALGAQVLIQSTHAGHQRYAPVLVGACGYALVALTGVVPAIHAAGVPGYLGLYLLAQLTSVGVMALFLKPRPETVPDAEGSQTPPGESLQSIGKYAFQTWLALLITAFVWQRMELYFVNRFHPKETVALYVAALTVGAFLIQPIALLSNALLPRFSADFARGDRDSIGRIYRESTLILAALVLFICAMGTVHAGLLASILFGRAYGASAPYISVLIWGAGLGVMATPGSALVHGGGRSGFVLYSGLFGVLAMAAIGTQVIARVPLIWGAAAKSLLQIFFILLGTWYTWRRMGFRPPLKGLLLTASAAACVGLVGLLLRRGLPVTGATAQVVVALGSGALLFIGYLLALHRLKVFPAEGTLYGALARVRGPRI